MKLAYTILRWFVVLLIIVLLAGLAWWYFFIRNQTRALPPAILSIGNNAPSFGGARATPYDNTVSGDGNTTPTTPAVTSSNNSGGTQTIIIPPRLWHVASGPVAGFGFVGTTTTLRFVERATGNVIEANPLTSAIVRRTNTLVPRIYEALVSGRGAIIERSVDTAGNVITFSDTIATATSSGPSILVQKQLAANITTIAISSDGKEIFYMVGGAAGSTGYRAQIDGSKATKVFSSGIAGWQVRWLSDGRIILIQNETDGAAGFAYELKQDGSLTPLASGSGLTILPRASSAATLSGTSNGSSLSLFAQLDANTKGTALPLRTIADKCVWAPTPSPAAKGKAASPTPTDATAFCAVPQSAPAQNFLDSWYRGLTHTADAWWRVSAGAGSVFTLFTPDSNLALDVSNPTINTNGSYIAFTNAADQSLWLLRIAQ